MSAMPTGAVPTEGVARPAQQCHRPLPDARVAGAVAVGDAGLSLPKSEPNQSPTCLPAFITQPILPAIQSMATPTVAVMPDQKDWS